MSTLSTTRPSLRRRLTLVGLALVALTLFGWTVWNQGAPARAVARLPAEERRALYDRTLRELAAICEQPVEAGFAAHCEEQRSFVALFPECKTECHDLLTRQTARFRPR